MEMNLPDEKRLRRYLLDELPEDERALLEERFISDREYLVEVEMAERDLIDEYVRAELSAGERQRFEKLFFASAQRRQKIEFARALKQGLETEEGLTTTAPPEARESRFKSLLGFLRGPHPVFNFSLALLALLFLAGGVWLATVGWRQRTQLATEREERQGREAELERRLAEENRRSEDLSLQLRREQEERERAEERVAQLEEQQASGQPERNKGGQTPASANFLLLSDTVRGSQEPQTLRLPAQTQTVHLRLNLEEADTAASFRAEVRRETVEGAVVWRTGAAHPLQTGKLRAVVLTLPARLLKPGQYVAVLLDEAGNVQNLYPFSLH